MAILSPSDFIGRSSRWGGDSISNYYLVNIISKVHGDVVARLPREVAIEVASEWDTLLSTDNQLVKAFNSSGYTTHNRETSAQVWLGHSPIEMSLDLEFYAQDSASTEVVDPILVLSKMALPRGGTHSGPFGTYIAPGPTIFNNENTGDEILVQIGNLIGFSPVIILGVATNYSGGMSVDGLPLKAAATVRFRTFYTLTGDDLEEAYAHRINQGI